MLIAATLDRFPIVTGGTLQYARVVDGCMIWLTGIEVREGQAWVADDGEFVQLVHGTT